jgi:hypothetical protein
MMEDFAVKMNSSVLARIAFIKTLPTYYGTGRSRRS